MRAAGTYGGGRGNTQTSADSATPSGRARKVSTRRTSATFDASRPCSGAWNIDSPANRPRIPTPYRPPTRRPSSSQVSTECATPRSNNCVYTATTSWSIQPSGRFGSAQPASTCSKAVSTEVR
ncbi:putative protein without homology [Propionibacterium freudenreichii subsp. shermanii]|nr:putative protein without homology [Propionibacterium freudenreichii subsp. shermanii]